MPHVRFLLFLFLSVLIGQETVAQSSPLTGVSVVRRSDGLGHVIRFRMTSPADSFRIIQPSADLIQVAIYKAGIRPESIRIPALQAPLAGMRLHAIPGGVGVDIRLTPQSYYIARAYPDANRRDLLVGTTESNAREIGILTQGMNAVDWAEINRPRPAPETVPDTTRAEAADTLALPLPPAPPTTLGGARLRTIVIDAGHGGRDTGARGRRGTLEKDVNLSVSLKLAALLRENLPGVNVVLTRSDDRFIELAERGSIANRARGDLFISIHCNSHRTSQPFGTEVYFLGLHRSDDAFEVMKKENSVIALEDPSTRSRELTDEELILYELTNTAYISNSQYLAGLIDVQFTERARRKSRGVKQAGFVVLYHASMPALLVELGFISNPNEEAFLRSDDGQDVLASAIFRAVREYKSRVEHE